MDVKPKEKHKKRKKQKKDHGNDEASDSIGPHEESEKNNFARKIKHLHKSKNYTFDVVAECRKMFRMEMVFLASQVEDFRVLCEEEVKKYKDSLEKYRLQCQGGEENGPKDASSPDKKTFNASEAWTRVLESLNVDFDFLRRRQTLLDREQEMLDSEDALMQRQNDLQAYENDIVEVERMLDRRQEMCNKRQQDLSDLEEELMKLKIELHSQKDNLERKGINTESATERAKRNWEIVRNNMFEKQDHIERLLNKYKMDLATAQSTINAKDLTIAKLLREKESLEDDMKKKESKVKQLESRLELTISESLHRPRLSKDYTNSLPRHSSENISIATEDTDHLSRHNSNTSKQPSRNKLSKSSSLPLDGSQTSKINHRLDSFSDSDNRNRSLSTSCSVM